MKTQTSLILFVNIVLAASPARGQGSFQNLGFESATLIPIPQTPGAFYFAQAFPGWNGSIGGGQSDRVFFNAISLCCSSVSLFGSEAGSNPQIEGTFSAALHAAPRFDGQPADTKRGA